MFGTYKKYLAENWRNHLSMPILFETAWFVRVLIGLNHCCFGHNAYSSLARWIITCIQLHIFIPNSTDKNLWYHCEWKGVQVDRSNYLTDCWAYQSVHNPPVVLNPTGALTLCYTGQRIRLKIWCLRWPMVSVTSNTFTQHRRVGSDVTLLFNCIDINIQTLKKNTEVTNYFHHILTFKTALVDIWPLEGSRKKINIYPQLTG